MPPWRSLHPLALTDHWAHGNWSPWGVCQEVPAVSGFGYVKRLLQKAPWMESQNQAHCACLASDITLFKRFTSSEERYTILVT